MSILRRHGPLIGASLVALVVHLVAAARIGGPSVSFDETGYLGTARWLAGSGGIWEMPTAPFYGVGYSLVIAPVTWIVGDPHDQWRAVLALNALLLTLVVPLTYGVVRRLLGASRLTATGAALIAGLVPAVLAAGVSAIAEVLVLPLVPALVLAAHRSLLPGRLAPRVAVGPLAAALMVTHSRFAPALLVTVAFLVLAWWRRLVPPVVALGNLVLLAGITLAGRLLAARAEDARWDRVERLEGGLPELRDLLSSRDGWWELMATAVGQAWYLAAGSLGLVVVGIAAMVALGRGRPLSARAAPGDVVGVAARWAATHLLVTAAVVFGASVAFFAQNQFRADHLVYGRHNDSFTPLWVACALVALSTASRRTVIRLVGLSVGITAGLSLALLALRDGGAHGARYSAFAVPAIIRFVGDDPTGTLWRASVAGVVGAAVVGLVVAVVRRPVALVPLLAVWFTWSGFGTVVATDSFETVIYRDLRAPSTIERLGFDAIAVDVTAAAVAYPALTYPFLLPDVDVTTFDPRLGEEPDQDAVLAQATDAELSAEGARIAVLDRSGYTEFWSASGGLAVWIRPGAEQDRLAAEGALLPFDWPTALPDEARVGELELLDLPDDRTVEVAPGGRTSVRLRGRHAGGGSPWPDLASDASPFRVRVTANVEPLDDGLPPGATTGGELPHWLLPGDVFRTDAEIIAVGRDLTPLPEGRYRVTLGVSQDAAAWFASGGPDASFTLVVRQP